MDDVDAETLLKMLCHIYNEEITEEQMDRKLLEAARRYQLDNLVSILRQMFQKARPLYETKNHSVVVDRYSLLFIGLLS